MRNKNYSTNFLLANSISAHKESLIITESKFIKNSLIIMLIALFLSPPPIEKLTYKFKNNDSWKAKSEQINGTYISSNYSAESHESKLTFRIIPSILGRLSFSNELRMQMLFLFLLQSITGLYCIYILLKYIYRYTQNWTYSIFATTGLMAIHLGTSFFYDVSYYLDGFVFFLMTISLFIPSRILAYLFLFLSFWGDERAILGGIGVLIFRNYTENKNIGLRNWIFSRDTVFMTLILVSYTLIRFWLIYKYSWTIPLGKEAGVSIQYVWIQINNIPIAQLLTFESYWLYLLPVFYEFYHRSKIIFSLFTTYCLSYLALSSFVWDVMRSLTYTFPVIILGIFILNKKLDRTLANYVSIIIAILSIIVPNYRYFEYFYLIIPLPIKILQVTLESFGYINAY
jgi:hypothetical protein